MIEMGNVGSGNVPDVQTANDEVHKMDKDRNRNDVVWFPAETQSVIRGLL
jgi:hypothetical protein